MNNLSQLYHHLTMLFLLQGSLLLANGCSFLEQKAIDRSAQMLVKIAPTFEKNANYVEAHSSIDAQILMLKSMQTMQSSSSEKLELHYLLTKSYTAKGLLFAETSFLPFQLTEDENPLLKNDILLSYSSAIEAAFAYLNLKGITFEDLSTALQSDDSLAIQKIFDQKLSTEENELKIDREVVFLLSQSLGGIAMLFKDRPSYVAQLPLIKSMMDWICRDQSNYYFGSCSIFQGVYYSSRPKMFGGDPEKGKEAFLKAITDHPANLFAKVTYLQYNVIAFKDEDEEKSYFEFTKVMDQLEEQSKLFLEQQLFSPVEKGPAQFPAEMNLLNAVAVERYHILKQNRALIFTKDEN